MKASCWKPASTVLVIWVMAAIASPAQTFNTLVNFNGADGSSPYYGSLIQGNDGNFYGTTEGGGNGYGTVFQLTPDGTLNTLHSFCSQAGCSDGANPYGGLIQASDHNFYGTTYAGGGANSNCNNGCGTVFQVNSVSGVLKTLHAFCSQPNCADGAGPAAGLIQATDGNLYGTTYAGGGGNCGSGCGTVFRSTLQGALTTFTLTNFSHAGAHPNAGVVQASDGNFYGTTEDGGTYTFGTVFQMTPPQPQSTFTTLYSFCSQKNSQGYCTDGAHPYAGVIQASDGNFYGTTFQGGDGGNGTAFEITSGGTLTTLYNFCSQTNCSDGGHPYAGLIQAADGNFYGTTSAGGANGDGEVFKMIAGPNSLYVLHSFDASDGQSPYAGLVQTSNGNLYGTTEAGGANGLGTVFGLYQASVTTWHNDNLRTGQNGNEIVLNASNVGGSASTFGELCSAALDGQVYAQPLVLANVTFQGTQYSSLVYVVTQNNTLYVINSTPPNLCQVLTSLSLNPAGQYAVDCNYVGPRNCNTIAPLVGALGTPVIQTIPTIPSSIGTLYVVTETQDVPIGNVPSNWYHYLHAVNLDQVAELTAPVRVSPPSPSVPSAVTLAQIAYWSRNHIQRPGLLLAGNYLYVAFSMMDGISPLPNGWLFRYDVTNLNAPPLYFATTTQSQSGGAGIWQGGAGLAYGPDESGTNYIYFNTGNGNYDGVSNWGDSFLKLDPTTLTVQKDQNNNFIGYFTPGDQLYRNCKDPFTDLDFGSGGVMLTPSTSTTDPAGNPVYWRFLAISGDKEGGIWAMDRGMPGEYTQCYTGPDGCSPCTTSNDQNVQTKWPPPPAQPPYPPYHNTPAYWNNNIYIGPRNGQVVGYQICNNYGSGQPFCGGPVYASGPGGNISTMDGATPAVSTSPESADAIVWLTSGTSQAEATQPGYLYALDALSMAQLYVNTGPGSTCSAVDTIAPVVKFSVPTVANGYLYLGTQSVQIGQKVEEQNNGAGTFYIFGPGRQCPSNPKPRQKSQAHAGLSNKASAKLE